MQGVEAAQIQRDDGVESVPYRIQSADHAGSAAERHHRNTVAAAVVEDGSDLLFAAWQEHRVGRLLLNLFAPQ